LGTGSNKRPRPGRLDSIGELPPRNIEDNCLSIMTYECGGKTGAGTHLYVRWWEWEWLTFSSDVSNADFPPCLVQGPLAIGFEPLYISLFLAILLDI
jgi:hypothetical protein